MNINAMAIRRAAMAIAAVAAVGALGACSIGQSGNATPAPQGSGGAGGGVSAASNDGARQGTDANGGTRQGTDAKGAPGANGRGIANAGGHPSCTNLKVTQSTPDLINGSTTQWKLPIMLTNHSGVPCTVQGFPGVRLQGADGTTWDLVRTNATGTPVLLGPGEHATADLTYSTIGDGGGPAWHVSSMAVTPPNSTNTQTLPWADSVDLVKQHAATHPGTYIGPARASTAG
ncbi:hypothetical protein GCM10010174_86880 [Kutzneria viridogrisea]|uniref:DUF4232 domain-containing protein n=1 Tax=Kutzneria viridogrisea TaxID=47990 RepID=A0ABR6BS45_9PSEU|nr:hypothetical protein [Kutzneria viridogrisea]